MTKARARPFVRLATQDLGALGVESPGLFLGRFDAEALRLELADAGLLQALAERGYPDVVVSTQTLSGEHRLSVRTRRGRVSLIDLRLTESASPVEEPEARARGVQVLSLLTIRWLALQHPKGHFTRERPRLPGQRYPGLGLAKAVVLRLLRWARAWGKDGLANVPQYYHNAVFYSPIFRFLSAVEQGVFEALRRDLARLSVARASAAVEAGRVVVLDRDEPFTWAAAEMVTPITAHLAAYLDSPPYQAGVSAGRQGLAFRVLPPDR
jgi:hypothetical protein